MDEGLKMLFYQDLQGGYFKHGLFKYKKFGWGGRIRTYDHGTRTRCLTAWLRPNG